MKSNFLLCRHTVAVYILSQSVSLSFRLCLFGMRVMQSKALTEDGVSVSSTLIRSCLCEGSNADPNPEEPELVTDSGFYYH